MRFWRTRSRVPRTYDNNQWSSPTKAKDRQISQKSKFSTIQEGTPTIKWVSNYYRKCMPWLTERSTCLFQLFKTMDAEAKLSIILHIMKDFREKSEAFD